MAQTRDTLLRVGRMHGLSMPEIEICERDQALLNKLSADQQYAARELQINSTPTFFINGRRLKGSMSFEEFEERIRPLLKE